MKNLNTLRAIFMLLSVEKPHLEGILKEILFEAEEQARQNAVLKNLCEELREYLYNLNHFGADAWSDRIDNVLNIHSERLSE